MANVKISFLWKKLESVLLNLEKSTQIWLLEKFINEANKSITGMLAKSLNMLNCVIKKNTLILKRNE